MQRVMVRYTVKPGRAAENERYIEQVFAELARTAPSGMQYEVFRLDDGVTFVHLYAHDAQEGSGLLPTLPAFQAFTRDIAERCDEPPLALDASLVGSYGLF